MKKDLIEKVKAYILDNTSTPLNFGNVGSRKEMEEKIKTFSIIKHIEGNMFTLSFPYDPFFDKVRFSAFYTCIYNVDYVKNDIVTTINFFDYFLNQLDNGEKINTYIYNKTMYTLSHQFAKNIDKYLYLGNAHVNVRTYLRDDEIARITLDVAVKNMSEVNWTTSKMFDYIMEKYEDKFDLSKELDCDIDEYVLVVKLYEKDHLELMKLIGDGDAIKRKVKKFLND